MYAVSYTFSFFALYVSCVTKCIVRIVPNAEKEMNVVRVSLRLFSIDPTKNRYTDKNKQQLARTKWFEKKTMIYSNDVSATIHLLKEIELEPQIG